MFYHFKQIPISINNKYFLISDVQLSQDVELFSPYKNNLRASEQYLPQSMYNGQLRLKYYLTGFDYLKQFIFADEINSLSGNIGGLIFNQGYISNYSISCSPNIPVEVSAEIQFFDKLSGNFNPTTPTNYNYQVLNFYNASIDNLNSYTSNVLNNISQVNFSYNCQLNPSYKNYTTGFSPTRADKISIGERTIAAEIVSDNSIFNLPLSGEKFGLNITFQNPSDSTINESFGVSGMLNSKQMSFSSNDSHSHIIRISQKHLNSVGEISGVITGNGIFTIHSTPGTHPFTSNDGTLSYINKIFVGEVLCSNYNLIRDTNNDRIVVSTPVDIVNDNLTIEGTKKTFIFPTLLNFDYSGIIISGLNPVSGHFGTPINISGENFYRISSVDFNGIQSRFQIVTPNLIQAIVPYGGLVGKIRIVSVKRNLTGFSSGFFYCEPDITSISPVTGMWGNSISIIGVNFSGTTGVQFNSINASGFSINSNNSITAWTPDLTQVGYPKGYVSVLTSGGISKSISVYQPHVPTYNFDPISGIYLDRINIRTQINTGYFYPSGNGFKVKFGNIDTAFYISGADYSGPYGTGDRSGIIGLSTTLDAVQVTGFINGKYDDNLSYLSGPTPILGKNLIFTFNPPQVIQEVKWYQNFTAIQGEGTTGSWAWFGSNDGSNWNPLTNIFVLGSSATSITPLNNFDYYKYYNMSGIATGNTNPSPWVREVEFKILTTGCLTGQVPIGAQDDYIYIYNPDGVTTYTPNTGKFNVISEPKINSFTPSIVNLYKFFSPVILGENFKFFFGKPYFFALSGGTNNNVQFYSNINSNSGTLADTVYFNNIMMTGSTGLYTAIIQNFAGSYSFTGALLVKSGINRALECSIGGTDTTYSTHRAAYVNDGNTGSYGALICSTVNEDNAFTLVPKNNKLIDVSLIKVSMENLKTLNGDTPNPSGTIKLFYRSAGTPIYNSLQIPLSGVTINLGQSPYTGIRTIKILTPKVIANSLEYLGISEFEIY